MIAEALAESENCALHLEDTAGAGGTLGRSFEELASLIEQAGGGKRLGVCLDSCHLLASGYDVRTAEGLAGVLDDFDAIVGLDRLALAALQRLGHPARLQRRPPRAAGRGRASAARAARRSSRSRGSTGCR